MVKGHVDSEKCYYSELASTIVSVCWQSVIVAWEKER